MIMLLMLLAGTQAGEDYETIDESLQPFVRYVQLPPTIEDGPNYAAALKFIVCSSSLAVDLRRHMPVEISPGLWRINLKELNWDIESWYELEASYPYADLEHPLLIDGRWLMDQLADLSRSDAYYLMLFGKEQPKTEGEFLQRTGVEIEQVQKSELTFGFIETASKVAVQKIRTMELIPRYGGYAAYTRDFRNIDAANSPFENLGKQEIASDASEIIVGIRKQWGSGYGSLQVYALANGDRDIVKEAPVDIAEDHSRFAGIASVRTPGSCMTCHVIGLNLPSEDGIRRWIQSGVEVYGDKKSAPFIERFWLTDTGLFLNRANEDYEKTVLYINGLTTQENAANVNAVISEYRQPVTIEYAANLFQVTPEDLKLALANSSESQTINKAHIVSLSHGFSVPIKVFESIYLEIERSVASWKSLNDVESLPSLPQAVSQSKPEPEPEEESKPEVTPSRSRVIRTYRR